MERIKVFFGGVRGRFAGVFMALMLVSMASAQADGISVFSEFQSQASGLIQQWSAVAVFICSAWVLAKLAPKFIKRLTSAA